MKASVHGNVIFHDSPAALKAISSVAAETIDVQHRPSWKAATNDVMHHSLSSGHLSSEPLSVYLQQVNPASHPLD